MQGDRQLDHAEAGAEVAAGDGHGIDGFGPQLVGQLAQLGDVEITGVGGEVDLVEQRGVGHETHVFLGSPFYSSSSGLTRGSDVPALNGQDYRSQRSLWIPGCSQPLILGSSPLATT